MLRFSLKTTTFSQVASILNQLQLDWAGYQSLVPEVKMFNRRKYAPSKRFLQSFPPSEARWIISSDAKHAHNQITGATLTYDGLAKGPVFPTRYASVEYRLKPISFTYRWQEIVFDFKALRQVKLTYGHQMSFDHFELLWMVNLNPPSLKRNGETDLSKLPPDIFRSIHADLLDVLLVWPDEADEDMPMQVRMSGMPKHHVILKGANLNNVWVPEFGVATDTLPGYCGLYRPYPKREKLMGLGPRPPWVRDPSKQYAILNTETGDSLILHSWHEETAVKSDRMSTQARKDFCFELKSGDNVFPLLISSTFFDPSPTRSQLVRDFDFTAWSLSGYHSARHACGIDANAEYPFAHEKSKALEEYPVVIQDEAIWTVGLEAANNWLSFGESPCPPPHTVHGSMISRNGCKYGRASLFAIWNLSCVGVFYNEDFRFIDPWNEEGTGGRRQGDPL